MAYRYKTFDYLPKPVSVERLEVTISRLLEDIADTPCKYLKLANSNTFLTYDSIYFIKKDGMKLIFRPVKKYILHMILLLIFYQVCQPILCVVINHIL